MHGRSQPPWRPAAALLYLHLIRFGLTLEQIPDGQFARYRLNVEPNTTVSARLIPHACPGRNEASDVDLFIIRCETEARDISTHYLNYSYWPGEDRIVYTRHLGESADVCAAVFSPPGPHNISCFNLLVEQVVGNSAYEAHSSSAEDGRCAEDAFLCAATGAGAGKSAHMADQEGTLDLLQNALAVGQFILRIALVILDIGLRVLV